MTQYKDMSFEELEDLVYDEIEKRCSEKEQAAFLEEGPNGESLSDISFEGTWNRKDEISTFNEFVKEHIRNMREILKAEEWEREELKDQEAREEMEGGA